MSHRTTVKTEFRDPVRLALACDHLGITYQRGEFRERFYQRDDFGEGDFKMKLKGWEYPVVVNTKTGEVHFDNYNGDWGDIERLNDVDMKYRESIVMDEAQLLILEGYSITTTTNEQTGDVQIILEQ
jgi:hypothetical protein